MDAIMEYIQPIIDAITGLASGEIQISDLITEIIDMITSIIGG